MDPRCELIRLAERQDPMFRSFWGTGPEGWESQGELNKPEPMQESTEKAVCDSSLASARRSFSLFLNWRPVWKEFLAAVSVMDQTLCELRANGLSANIVPQHTLSDDDDDDDNDDDNGDDALVSTSGTSASSSALPSGAGGSKEKETVTIRPARVTRGTVIQINGVSGERPLVSTREANSEGFVSMFGGSAIRLLNEEMRQADPSLHNMESSSPFSSDIDCKFFLLDKPSGDIEVLIGPANRESLELHNFVQAISERYLENLDSRLGMGWLASVAGEDMWHMLATTISSSFRFKPVEDLDDDMMLQHAEGHVGGKVLYGPVRFKRTNMMFHAAVVDDMIKLQFTAFLQHADTEQVISEHILEFISNTTGTSTVSTLTSIPTPMDSPAQLLLGQLRATQGREDPHMFQAANSNSVARHNWSKCSQNNVRAVLMMDMVVRFVNSIVRQEEQAAKQEQDRRSAEQGGDGRSDTSQPSRIKSARNRRCLDPSIRIRSRFLSLGMIKISFEWMARFTRGRLATSQAFVQHLMICCPSESPQLCSWMPTVIKSFIQHTSKFNLTPSRNIDWSDFRHLVAQRLADVVLSRNHEGDLTLPIESLDQIFDEYVTNGYNIIGCWRRIREIASQARHQNSTDHHLL